MKSTRSQGVRNTAGFSIARRNQVTCTELTGNGIGQDRKGRLAKLAASLAMRQTTLRPVVAFDTVGAPQVLAPCFFNSAASQPPGKLCYEGFSYDKQPANASG